MARKMRREPEVILAALAPPPEQRSVTTPHSPTGKQEEPAAAVSLPVPEVPAELPVPQRLLPTPPPAVPEPPAPPASQPWSAPPPGPRSAFRRASSTSPPNSHPGGGNEVLPGSGGSPTTEDLGPF